MLPAAGTDLVGAAVLALLGLAALAWLWRLRQRLRLTAMQSFWYGVNVVLCRVLWRARISGPLPVAPRQGAVVVSNHRSPVDPCFIELTTTRPVHWMVAKEYCNHWTLGWFLRLSEVIPTNRAGIDIAATKAAIRRAKQGGIVGIFPEGRLNLTDRLLLPGHLGAALIALKARVPVVPCYIQGSPFGGSILSPLVMPAKVVLWLGPPLDLSEFYGRERDRGVLEEVTRRFLREIARLAGVPDYQPDLARASDQRTSVAVH